MLHLCFSPILFDVKINFYRCQCQYEADCQVQHKINYIYIYHYILYLSVANYNYICVQIGTIESIKHLKQ